MTGPILAAADLAVRREHGDVVILDATVELAPARHDGDHSSSSGRPGWERAHIPGSRHADLLHDLSDPAAPYHFARPAPEILAERLAELGVRDGVPVVTYDRAGGIWAARLWWLLHWLGADAHILDGGLTAWQSAGFPTASHSAGLPAASHVAGLPAASHPAGFAAGSDPAGFRPSSDPAGFRTSSDPDRLRTSSRPTPAGGPAEVPAGGSGVPSDREPGFGLEPRNGRWVNRADLERWLAGETEATVLCALNPEAFAGEVPTRYSRRGHIPGTGNLPARSLLTADGRFRPLNELRDELSSVLTGRSPIWLYCGGGISAATLGLALTALGRDDVALYDGSLEEWSADSSLPLELGRGRTPAEPHP